MPVRMEAINDVFSRLGAALQTPTRLCLIGSAPGIATGQPERQTMDVDVWFPGSHFDATDLARACAQTGVIFDPKGEIDPEKVYLQIVRPGIVRLPRDFEAEVIAVHGNLTVIMPPPEVLSASKLVRGDEIDVLDVIWWMNQRGLGADEVAAAIDGLPREADRDTARENLVFVALVSGSKSP